jgi:hypothetical protein
MNYPYPIPSAQTDPTLFTASALGQLGAYNKPLDARTLITVEYGSLTPSVTLVGYSFRIRPGGEPQLWLDAAALDATETLLTFYVEGGIAGQAYEVIINAMLADTEVRTDVLTVNVLGENGCGCMVLSLPPAGWGGATSGDGSIIVNTAPRFFVSATEPVGANVLDRWYNSITGDIADFVTNGLVSWWEAATVGGGGGYGAQVVTMNPIRPDGVTTDFMLTAVDGTIVAISTANTLLVSVDGVWQEPITQYEASGNQIGFAQAPSSDSVVFILWLSPPPATPPAPGP